jgi:glycosyltransferase involved in cell wall biosynthesis
MMPSLPLVSVGLPTYNRPQQLERTLQYLINQDYQNIEIIVSDNCSPNAYIKSLLEKYAKLDKRIQFIIQKENIEIEPNFNYVYKRSQGDYFMWISDDDIFDNHYILACVKFLESNKDYILCSGVSDYYLKDTFLFKEKTMQLSNNYPVLRLFKYYLQVYKNGVFYGVYRNNFRFENPIQHHIGGDWNHIARTALLGKINVLNDVHIMRSDDGGSSSREKIALRWNITGIKKIFLETYMSYRVAKYLFNEPIVKNRYNFLSRFIIQTMVFFILNAKFLMHSIRKRMR